MITPMNKDLPNKAEELQYESIMKQHMDRFAVLNESIYRNIDSIISYVQSLSKKAIPEDAWKALQEDILVKQPVVEDLDMDLYYKLCRLESSAAKLSIIKDALRAIL